MAVRSRGDIVGVVDLGSREIRVLIGRREDGGAIQIVGHGTAPGRGSVSQGVIQDRNAAQLALKRALADAEKEARTRVTSLFCGVNGRNVETFIREGQARLEHEVVSEAHLDEARDIASRDILAAGKKITSSITAQEWYVDDMRVVDPTGIRGQVLRTRVHFARLPAVIQDNIRQCIESQHRELEDAIFAPLAASLGCLTPEDMELGVAVLDMGRSTTGLAVFRDHGILGTHCFEWGGYHITRDVAAGLQVSFEEADELILEYGLPVGLIRAEFGREGDAPEAARPQADRGARIKLKTAVPGAPAIVERSDFDVIVFERAKELMVKVRQHLHARGLSKSLIRGVVLTGGASRIKNYTALAEAVFQVPCRVGYPNSVEILPHAVEAPEFSVAVGIVRHAFDYRTAAKEGRVEARGAAASWRRRLVRFFRKYFL
ncbi:MAG: cell division protein FtsA [Candidatus Hydrogenedentes bacterium]|nr:cell division protein FtsA [Candidatus Hydrogenedentota bacterium]